jgi:AcrR family transcriptional regulator
MEWQLHPKMNEKLFLKDPQQSEVGKKILKHSISLIKEIGFEAFTFKKLAELTKSTEATTYRYFENKHRLLVYIVAWYWHWLDFQVLFYTNNVQDTEQKIKIVIDILTWQTKESEGAGADINFEDLHEIITTDASKVYLTKHVSEDNQAQMFKPYKDLCQRISGLFLDYNPGYSFPRSLASTLMEMAHFQDFFMLHLPSLTDFPGEKNLTKVKEFLESLVFSAIRKDITS